MNAVLNFETVSDCINRKTFLASRQEKEITLVPQIFITTYTFKIGTLLEKSSISSTI